MTPIDKRRALGRGLDALLPEPSSGTSKRDYYLVGIEEVHPSRQNPRQDFDDEQLRELSESIRQKGVIQPLIVRTRPAVEGGGFYLIAGERRWRASQKAGLKEVPVVVREASDREAFELALVENLQRSDLNPIEQADGYRRMCDEYGCTQDEVAQRVGKERSTVSNTLRLLRLPEKVQAMLAENRLQMGHARALLSLDQPKAIEAAAARVVARGLSVRQTEQMVRDQGVDPKKGGRKSGKSASARDLEKRLSQTLGTPVRVVEKSDRAGRIELDYLSLDDLDRLLERLLPA